MTYGQWKCDTYIQLEYYSTVIIDKTMYLTGKWMKLEQTVLSEVISTQKDQHHMLFH